MSKIPCTVEQFNQAFCEFHKEIEMMKNPKNKQQWIQNVFAGDPPTGYASWRDWIDSSEKRGAFIRKAEFEDWSGIIKPAAPEWDGEGLPPVGYTHKDCELVGVVGYREGFEVIAHRGVAAVIWGPDKNDPEGQADTMLASHFRPLRTPEQREREELVDLLRDTPTDIGFGQFDDAPETLADAILSKYNLEPKQ